MTLSNRKVRVEKPRLRRKGPGVGAEVEVPAYETMQRDERLGQPIPAVERLVAARLILYNVALLKNVLEHQTHIRHVKALVA